MKKSVLLLVLVSAASAAFTASSYAQQNWAYSYDFAGGPVVSGTFTGYQVGNTITGYVEDVNNLTMSINGVSVAGPIYAEMWSPSGWLDGSVISFDPNQNNLLFINSDLAGGNASYTDYFESFGPSISGALDVAIDSSPIGLFENDYPAKSGSWSLVDPPVPDGGTTIALFAMSLTTLGWLRRKLA